MNQKVFFHSNEKKLNEYISVKKDTPQSELLFKMVLYQNTSASGHNSRPQNIESTVTVNAINATPVGITILKNLKEMFSFCIVLTLHIQI